MKELYRLVYTSSRRPRCTDEEIAHILDSCKRNNPARNITGVLLHSDKRFLQYLEGGQQDLLALFDRIAADERHGGVNLRDFSRITERSFPAWHMGYKDVATQALEFNTSISSQDKETFQSLIAGQSFDEAHSVRVMKLFFELA